MNPAGAVDSRLTQEKVRSVYNGMARIYDLWGANMEGRARKRGIELAGVQDGECILDVATGTGLILVELARRNPHGLNAGLSPQDARFVADQVMLGTASLVKDSSLSFEELNALAPMQTVADAELKERLLEIARQTKAKVDQTTAKVVAG